MKVIILIFMVLFVTNIYCGNVRDVSNINKYIYVVNLLKYLKIIF